MNLHSMMTWWQTKTARERIFLTVGLLVVAFALIQYGYVKPVNRAIANQRQLALEHQKDQAWLEVAVPKLEQLRKKPLHSSNGKATTANIESSLEALKEKGFASTLKQTRENTVDIQWQQVSFNQWLDWLNTVERDNLGKIQTLRVQALSVPDEVAVQLQILLN